MTLPDSPPETARRSWPRRILRWCFIPFQILFVVLLLSWATLAIYYSNLPWAPARTVLAVMFLAFGIWTIGVKRTKRTYQAFAIAFLALLVWWILIPPSHDRPWRTEVASLPRAVVEGDHVHISGVRDFEYRSRDDFTVRYEERDVSIAHLYAADFYISYWTPGPVGHTFVSFCFDNAPPLCISIETRPEIGESFAPIASLFKQFELIYVVGSERDVVGVRTNFRNEQVYLYRLRMPAENARKFFRAYLERINEVADQPEWYHLLSNSCTVNTVRYANAAGRQGGFNIRHLLNGLMDYYLYMSGAIDSPLPFDELREASNITKAAQAAGDGEDFSERIRRGLPTFPVDPVAPTSPP